MGNSWRFIWYLMVVLMCFSFNLGCSQNPTAIVEESSSSGGGSSGGSSGGGSTEACPANYVKILANTSYGTNSFCISKYEMKVAQNDGTPVFDGYNGGVALDVAQYKPESRASGIPWVRILYSNMISECSSLGSGYHLVTAKEWQIVAREIESVGANWSGGSVGLYTGHSDGVISGTAVSDGYAVSGTTSLSAGDGSDPYVGTGQTSALAWGAGKEQKRTFTLSSGNEIWDMSGNVRDTVDVDGSGGVLNYTGPSSASFYDVNSTSLSTMLGASVSSNAISISASWFLPSSGTYDHTTNKIGKVYLLNNSQTGKLITRGGNFSSGNSPGLTQLILIS